MKILKTVTKDQVRLLMDFDYNNVYGRIRYVLGKEAVLFSDIHIKNPEVHWVVRDDAEYVALSELPSEKVSEVKNLLSEKISYVTNVLSGDSLLCDYVAKITTYPSDDYIFVNESNGELNVVIAGWGCNLSTQGNKEMSSVEDCAEEVPEDPSSDIVNNDSSNASSAEHGYHNNGTRNNVTTFNMQTINKEQELVCPKCKATYPAGSTFCPRDGERLTTLDNLAYYCEKCGTQYSSDTKFCPKDGGAVVCRVAGQHYSQHPDTNNSFDKASLGARFIASLLDGLICGVLAIPAIILYAIGLSNETYNNDYYYHDYSKAGVFLIFAFILYLIPLIYTFIKDGLGNGQSWGKKAMGLRTINVKDYSKCTKGASALRALVSTLVSMIPLVGWIIEPIMVLTTSDGRRLADKAAGTMVVNSK